MVTARHQPRCFVARADSAGSPQPKRPGHLSWPFFFAHPKNTPGRFTTWRSNNYEEPQPENNMLDATTEIAAGEARLPMLFTSESPGTGLAPQSVENTHCQNILCKMLDDYQEELAEIDRIAALAENDGLEVITHFLRGNLKNRTGIRYIDPRSFLAREGAVAHLNASYWDKAIRALPDIYQCLPQPRKDDWHNQIHDMTTPDFTEDNAMATFSVLFDKRGQFFAERIDGVFKALSDQHVTNAPQGFGKRMILKGVYNEWDLVSSSQGGSFNDLRVVVAKFMGRDEPSHGQSMHDLQRIRKNPGLWHTLDGGAIRIRVYKKGTAHIEIHPDMAWRLNSVLHQMYPKAIPENFRRKPKKERKKSVEEAIQKPLPFEVIAVLSSGSIRSDGTNVVLCGIYDASKSAVKQAGEVLESLGGVSNHSGSYLFEFDCKQTLETVILSGLVPDKDSHQFYPTPDSVADVVMDMAGNCTGLKCLEPSAGQGSLATRLPQEGTTCVEISSLHCSILESKGLSVVNADFIEWAETAPARFDRIVMNPPFRKGRWKGHLEAALGLLGEGGRLVSVLPASAKGSVLAEGWQHTWSDVIEDAFAGTGVRVVVVALEKE